MSKKKESKFNFFWDKVLSLNTILDAGKYVLILTVSAMAIHYLINIIMTIDGVTARAILYSIVPLIPIYISMVFIEDISKIYKTSKKDKEKKR